MIHIGSSAEQIVIHVTRNRETSRRTIMRRVVTAVLFLTVIRLSSAQILSYGNGQITWSNQADAVFDVEWASSLTLPDWTNSWDSLTAISSTDTVIDVGIPMFFRVDTHIYEEVTNSDACYAAYSNALLDSKVALAGEISHTLWPVSTNTPGTEWRLFTNWVDHTTSLWVRTCALKYAAGWTWDTLLAPGTQTMMNGFSGDVWVTLYPQLFDLCADYKGSHQLLRMEKALGLPPRDGAYGVAEIFIDPKYLFRPAPDTAINDTSAGLADGPNVPYLTANSLQGISPGYVDWYKETYDSRGYDATNELNNCWPWTRLGYTYDYANVPTRPYGLSEYVIVNPSATNFWGDGLVVPFFVDKKTAAELYGH